MRFKLILLSLHTSFMFSFAPLAHAQVWQETSCPNNPILSMASMGRYLYAGTDLSGIFRSSDSGKSWTAVNNGIPTGSSHLYSIVVSGSNLYAAAAGFGVFRSTDSGNTWTPAHNGMTTPNVIALAASGANLYAGTDKGTFHSIDSGNSWDSTSNANVFSLAVSGDTVLEGCDLDNGLEISTDSGGHWTEETNGLSGAASDQCILINDNNVFMGSYTGFFKSTDNGQDWTHPASELASIPVFRLAIYGPYLFAGAEGGFFVSTDLGEHWTKEISGLIDTLQFGYYDTTVEGLCVFGNYLFAGEQGVWRTPLSEFGNAGVQLDQAATSTIDITPNPTTNFLSVHGAPAETHVSVLNMLGQTVLEFPNPGSGDFSLDLSRLQPGTYCVRLTSPDANTTRMIVRE